MVQNYWEYDSDVSGLKARRLLGALGGARPSVPEKF